LNKPISAGKTGIEEGKSIAFREWPYVRRTHLVLCGLFSDHKQKSIVERTNIGHTEQKMATEFQRPSHLVEDPKYFLGMFEHLVGHNEIRLAIG